MSSKGGGDGLRKFQAGTATELWMPRAGDVPGYAMRNFDVSPDGRQIVFDRIQENSETVLMDLPPLRN